MIVRYYWVKMNVSRKQIEMIQFIFAILIQCTRNSADNSGSCGEKLSTRVDQDVFSKHKLVSRVIDSQPISKAFECYVRCMKNCRCLSYNVCNGGKLCELNSEKKENNISLYKASEECDYYEYEFSKKVPSAECQDPCCSTSNPCSKGLRCQATCMKNTKRYHCQGCPAGHGGDNCELPTTCAFYAQHKGEHGERILYNSSGKTMKAYCHLGQKYALTLVMSFSKEKGSDVYRHQPLFNDFPQRQNDISFSDYRMSLAHMKDIRHSGSTHWLYGCAYPSLGYRTDNQIRGKFSEIDILEYRNTTQNKCQTKFERISIDSVSCTDCSTDTVQGDEIFHITGKDINCGGLSVPQQTCDGGMPADYFGVYHCAKTSFRCTQTDKSNTQLWFATENE